jgi:hypothetical protein
VGDLKLNKKGDRLVASASNGAYIFVYSTLNTKNNFLPVQKFCLETTPCPFYNSIDIVEVNFDNLLKPNFNPNLFKIDVSLIIVTA